MGEVEKMARRKKEVQTEFGSVAEYVTYASENRRENGYGLTYENRDSYCPVSGEEAIRLGTMGDQARTKELFDAAAAVKGAGENLLPEVVRDVTGDYFDVGDVLSGVPECWYSEAQQPIKTAVDVIFNFCYSGACSVTEAQYRGAALVTLVDALTAGGYIPNITLYTSLTNYRKEIAPMIHIANDPLDIDAIAFAACNPAMCRRVTFAYEEYITGRDQCGGYGHPQLEVYKAEYRNSDDSACIFFDYMHYNRERFDSAKSTRELVEFTLKQLETGEKFITVSR